MKYIAKEIEENVNISKNNALMVFFRIIITIILILITIYISFGIIINIGVKYIPVTWEINITKSFVNKIDSIFPEKALEIEKRIDTLTNNNRKYFVKILKSDEINAFALPGNNIVIYDALLNNITDEELDFVLAHEVGHFQNRDISKKYARLFIFSILSSFISKDQGQSIFFDILNNTEMKFSQTDEINADKYAFELIYKKYKNLDSAESFFNKILKDKKLSKFDYYFSSHPHPEKRIDKIKEYKRLLNN